MAPAGIPQAAKYRLFELFKLNYSLSMALKQVKGEGMSVSRATIGRVFTDFKNLTSGHTLQKLLSKKPGLKIKLNRIQQTRLKKFLSKDDPPTLRNLASKFNVSPSTIYRYLARFDYVKRSKRRTHYMTQKTIEKREMRAGYMYNLLSPKTRSYYHL